MIQPMGDKLLSVLGCIRSDKQELYEENGFNKVFVIGIKCGKRGAFVLRTNKGTFVTIWWSS